MISFLGSFALKFASFAHFMLFRLNNLYDLRAVSWGKFIWMELICVKKLTFRNSGNQYTYQLKTFEEHLLKSFEKKYCSYNLDV